MGVLQYFRQTGIPTAGHSPVHPACLASSFFFSKVDCIWVRCTRSDPLVRRDSRIFGAPLYVPLYHSARQFIPLWKELQGPFSLHVNV